MHSVPKSAEDGEFWSQYTISVKYLAKLDVSAEVVITDIVSFLPKILGRNQDFAIGLAWGGELTFKNAWGEIGFGEE